MDKPEFAIIFQPVMPDLLSKMTSKEEDIIGRHFLYMKTLHEEGMLVYAGRSLDAEFGIAIFRADSQTDAQALMEADPAIKTGLFTGKLKPFQTSLIFDKLLKEYEVPF